MNIHSKIVCWLVFSICWLIACTDELDDNPVVQTGNAIRFSIMQCETETTSRSNTTWGNFIGNEVLRSLDGADTLTMDVYSQNYIHTVTTPSSRGVVTTLNNLSSFGVYGKKDEEQLFSNLPVTRHMATGQYIHQGDYFWMGSQHTYEFIALSPYSPTGVAVGMDSENILPAWLQYIVPSNAVEQNDIMIATPGTFAGDYNQSVPLTFRHLCSAVNVKVGSIPQGIIKSVLFKGIHNKGTYSISRNEWEVSADTTHFAIDFVGTSNEYETTGVETDNPQINDANATFMMIPQTLHSEAQIEIIFTHTNTGREEKLTAGLANSLWTMGETYNYLISITPDCKLEFTTQVEKQDAHYVICKVPFRVTNLPEGGEWQMVASAKDGNTQVDVTLQRAADVNTFAKQGFWIDKVMNGNTITNESARGTNTITGTVDTDGVDTAYVFIPENVTENNREITLTLSQKGKDNLVSKTILQASPRWTDNYGWENVDDDEAGPYGFCWTRKIAYIFPYNLGNLFCKYTKSQAYELINGLIGQYNAQSYASIVEFNPSWGATRVYVWLDYTKLNNLSVANSSSDGFANTIALDSLGGSATSSAFEEALKNTKKTEEGKEGENMFRLKNGDNNVPDAVGDNNVSSGIMNYVLKKNRYYLRKTQESSVGTTTTAPYIQTSDIVWYLPAYGQFSSNTSINGADYWSSTAADGGTEAYLGNGTKADRTSTHKVIAVRNKP